MVEVQFSIVSPSVDWLMFPLFFFFFFFFFLDQGPYMRNTTDRQMILCLLVRRTEYNLYIRGNLLCRDFAKYWKLVPHTSSSLALRAARDLLKLGPSHRKSPSLQLSALTCEIVCSSSLIGILDFPPCHRLSSPLYNIYCTIVEKKIYTLGGVVGFPVPERNTRGGEPWSYDFQGSPNRYSIL